MRTCSEEIDSMYISGVKPWKSSSWVPPEGEELAGMDHANLADGNYGKEEGVAPGHSTREDVAPSL